MLNRRGLEVARRLAEWRRRTPAAPNRPLRSVLRDDLLVAIAKRQPTSRRDLEALRDFNRPHLLSRAGEILDVIAEAQAVPADDLPDAGRAARRGAGRGDGREPALGHPRPMLRPGPRGRRARRRRLGPPRPDPLAGRGPPRGPSSRRSPSGWRREVCGETLLDVLTGRRALRVVDPEADVPVALDPV